MTTGYVLILAVLILGGVIATLGDRIGMRVGRARLSLFNLRPRQTATLVSIATGSIISASTLALLFGISRQLRTGVFELEGIQSDLSQAKSDLGDARSNLTDAKSALSDARTETDQIEDALTDARQRQQQAQAELQTINESLRQAVARQQTTQTQLRQSQTQLTQSRRQLNQLRSQLSNVSEQTERLTGEIQRLDTERTALLEQQRTVQGQLAERDQRIAARDREIAQRQQTLSQLQAQRALLEDDIVALQEETFDLERQFEGLFRGSVALGRNESLVSGLIQVNRDQEARQAVDQLLSEANQTAIQQLAPGTSLGKQVLLIPQEEVTRLVNRIRDRREYVVRIISEANYIIGEPCVVGDTEPCIQVYAEAVVNEVIYGAGERLATVSVDPRTLTNQSLVEQLNLLIASLQFRARQDGIVGDTLQIANGRTDALIAFLDEIRKGQQFVEIQAIAAEPIYTAGPLRVELLAISTQGILARTDELPRPLPDANDEESSSSEE